MSELGIDVDACRKRQRRLNDRMAQAGWDLVVVTQPEHVQYLAGPRFEWYFQPAAALTADGRLLLAAPNEPPEVVAADEVHTYPAQWHATLRNDQRHASTDVLQAAIGKAARGARVGVEFSSFGRHWDLGAAAIEDVEPCLYEMRRVKDDDELRYIRQAIAGTAAMYQRAREIIEPGISELEVYSQLYRAAVHEFGERPTAMGNDYQCGSPGGPPRDGRLARPGELYILDLGPAFRGYFADNARTIAVSHVSDLQLQAWTHLMQVFEHVEHTVKPGRSARQLFQEVQAMLDEAPCGAFMHHLGHGFGLFPHEAPHLNPHWDDTFQEGELFTVEPGLYAAELQAGMRIENNYRVTADGVERLTPFPMELDAAG